MISIFEINKESELQYPDFVSILKLKLNSTHPSNPNKLIAAMWEHKRDPWFFKSGGSGSGLHITHDGGTTWKKITDEDGFPKGDLGRIGIAIAPNKPNIVYALVEAKKNALYKSVDGSNWEIEVTIIV